MKIKCKLCGHDIRENDLHWVPHLKGYICILTFNVKWPTIFVDAITFEEGDSVSTVAKPKE